MRRHSSTLKGQLAVAGHNAQADLNGAAHAIMEHAGERIREYGGKAKVILHKANNMSLADVQKKASVYVRNNPGRTIAAAAVAGILIGFYLRRR